MTLEYYYRILGLNINASETAIKEAYRRKAKKFHPDLNSNPNAGEIFIELSEAYQYLLSKKARERKSREVKKNNGHFDRRWEEEKRKKAQAYARKHAKMKYEQFEKSYLFKSARLFVNLYDYLVFFMGILSIVSSILGVFLTVKAEKFNADTVMIAFFGILIGVLFIAVTYKKFKF